MDFIYSMFMARALEGSPAFAVDQLKGIYYTKDIKIQKENKFPNKPGGFLEEDKLNLRLYIHGISSGSPSKAPTRGCPWLPPLLCVDPGRQPVWPSLSGEYNVRLQEGFLKLWLSPPFCHLWRPPKGWADGFSLVPST